MQMGIWKKIGLGISGLCAVVAAIATAGYLGPHPVSAPVGGISFSWLPTLLTALGLGTTTSLPVLIPKLVDLFKRYVLPVVPASIGGAKALGALDVVQISSYVLQIERATTAEEKAGITVAARACFDAARDRMFPLAVAYFIKDDSPKVSA